MSEERRKKVRMAIANNSEPQKDDNIYYYVEYVRSVHANYFCVGGENIRVFSLRLLLKSYKLKSENDQYTISLLE